jgi:hypothetical protein
MSTELAQVLRTLRQSSLPKGLCADRAEHPGHLHESSSLGRFWCTGDPADREPGRSQRRLDAGWQCPVHGPGQPCNSMCGLAPSYGIRPHLPMTPDDLAEREQVMRATPLVPLSLLGLPGHTLGDPSSSTPRSSGSAAQGC